MGNFAELQFCVCVCMCVGTSMLEQEALDLPCPLINTLPMMANNTPVVSLVMLPKLFTLQDDCLSTFSIFEAGHFSLLRFVNANTLSF